MRVDGNTFADSTANLGVGLDAYENPVSQMYMTRNIFFNTTRLNPKPDAPGVPLPNRVSETQHFYPVSASPPYNMTTDEYQHLAQPKCPESWAHPKKTRMRWHLLTAKTVLTAKVWCRKTRCG